MSLSTSSSDDKPELLMLSLHRGAIDQTTITTKPPFEVMKHVNTILQETGVQIQEESTFLYRCIRVSRRVADNTSSVDLDHGQGVDIQTHEDSPFPSIIEESGTTVLYGGPSEDTGDEVRFSVELTRLAGLNDTYSLDIRRLKGNLRSYKFIYDTIRNRAQVNH